MEPHQRGASAADLALDQRQMLAAVDNVAEDDGLQHTAFDRKRLLGNALDQDFIGQAMRNEFLDVNDRQRMLRREFAQFLEPCGLAVLAQDRAQRSDRTHPRRAHQIDRALGASDPHHHAAAQRHQRQDVTRHHDIVWRGFVEGDHRDHARAIAGRDTGGGAFARVDQHAGLLVRIAVVGRRLQRNTEFAETLVGNRDGDDAARLARHEIDVVGGDFLGRHHEVAFGVLALLRDHHDHLSVAQAGENFF